ncbi:MAG: ROK family protein, partial [Chloroflexi bacterium]|nr:ROK family protein [Chloroflexota bacterium]
LGGTKIATAMVTDEGQIEAFDRRPTLAQEGRDAVIGRMEAAVRAVLSQVGRPLSDVIGIGIGAPGPCNYQTGVVTQPPALPGWYNVPLKAIFEERFGIPTFVGNDANAAAQAEHLFGAGRGTRNMICVTMGTGIGGGLILNGRLYVGTDGAAGEIGHMIIDDSGPRCNCGNIGCWEALGSGTALAADAVRRIARGTPTSIVDFARAKGGDINARVIAEAAQAGDPVANELIARVAHFLGVGLVNLVHVLNPEMIVIGGGMAQMGDVLLEPARRVLEERGLELPSRRVRIVASELGDEVGVLGAATQVLEAIGA